MLHGRPVGSRRRTPTVAAAPSGISHICGGAVTPAATLIGMTVRRSTPQYPRSETTPWNVVATASRPPRRPGGDGSGPQLTVPEARLTAETRRSCLAADRAGRSEYPPASRARGTDGLRGHDRADRGQWDAEYGIQTEALFRGRITSYTNLLRITVSTPHSQSDDPNLRHGQISNDQMSERQVHVCSRL